MEETCCPLYTIRLDALNFKLSKTQRRVLKVWNEFLKFDKRPAVRGDVSKHNHQAGTSTQLRKKKEAGPTPPVLGKNRERKQKVIRRNRCFEKLKSQNIDIEQVQIYFPANSLNLYLSTKKSAGKKSKLANGFLNPIFGPTTKHLSIHWM
jgi:arginyl-tRNA--protein-N-Asp/Glu arginylyltransferase